MLLYYRIAKAEFGADQISQFSRQGKDSPHQSHGKGKQNRLFKQKKWAEFRFKPMLRPLAVKLRISLDSAARAGHPSEITLQVTTEYQLRIVQGSIVDKPVQFGTGIDARSDHVLNLGAVNRDNTPVRIAQFNIASIDVKLTR